MNLVPSFAELPPPTPALRRVPLPHLPRAFTCRVLSLGAVRKLAFVHRAIETGDPG